MSSPAIRALKESFNCRITILTSAEATVISSFIPCIDDVITLNLPWDKTSNPISPDTMETIIEELKTRNFDAAIIFSVYSQNPLPAAMLAWLAGIPLRLSYCRENPYELLTDWLPDKEPYYIIKHQVRRDLDLVARVGAYTHENKLSLKIPEGASKSLNLKLQEAGVDIRRPRLIMHAGVKERDREYPADLWINTAIRILMQTGYQVLFTGSRSEEGLTSRLQRSTGPGSFSLGGVLNFEEFIALVDSCPLVISVNTATVHIAAATETPMIVLYALTNPQHSPWKASGYLLPFNISREAPSKNEIIHFVNDRYFSKPYKELLPLQIVSAAMDMLNGRKKLIPEMPFV